MHRINTSISCTNFQYKTFQKHCQREIRRAEWKYINDTIQTGLENNNPKPFWNLIKSRKCDNMGVSPLRQNGKLHIEPEKKAKILLNQFKSMFTQGDDSYITPPTNQTIPNCQPIIINTAGVAKLLSNIQTHKASGPDNIPNTVLKTCTDTIAPSHWHPYHAKYSNISSNPKSWIISWTTTFSATISMALENSDHVKAN